MVAALGCADNAAPHGANLITVSGLYQAGCGRTENSFRCWGYGVYPPPTAPLNTMQVIRSNSYGSSYCGVDNTRTVSCWGGIVDVVYPIPGVQFSDVVVGDRHRCALATSGTVYCWGDSQLSGLSDADTSIHNCSSDPINPYYCVSNPTPIASSERFTAIAAGSYHTCALATGGQVFCWGAGSSGQLGRGPDVDFSQLPAAIESTQRFRKLAAALERSCGINTSNELMCWGTGYAGSFGDGEASTSHFEPVMIAMPGGVAVKAIGLGSGASCSLGASGLAYCWGGGAAGIGTGTGNSTPLPVLGRLEYTSIAAGEDFACGIASDGAWCWGDNGYGQLGNGGSTASPIPVRVAGQDQFDD